MRLGSAIIAAAISGALAGPATAKDKLPEAASARVVDELLACQAITAADGRLACFDRTTAAFAEARSKRQLVVLDREGTKQVKRKVFGFSMPSLKLFGGGKGDDEPEVTEIESTVSRTEDAGRGFYRYALADGSVWQTVEEIYGNPPRSGEQIKVKAGILGAYIAIPTKGRATRVKRVR